MATQNRSTQDQENQQQQRGLQDEQQQRGTEGDQHDGARDGATDRGGTGGYGASSGFSEETSAGSDQRGERDTQHGDDDSNPNGDVGMRGRNTGRADGDAMR